MQLIVISGLSGSGKSIALTVLEDNGYYCVDNLPANLLPEVTVYLKQSGHERVAVSIDARSRETLHLLPQRLADLRQQKMDVHLVFLDTKTDTLVKRFSETRRRHPLSDNQSTLPECIEMEREMLREIHDLANRIDTSDLSASSLRAWIRDFIGLEPGHLTLLFQSFGFKHGIPLDSDMVFDVRCLPNPHYEALLRPLTGKDGAVIEYMDANSSVHRMFEDIRRFVDDWLPCFIRDNRNYLTVAIGCTGGRHRSVYFVERLARYFTENNQVLVRHRELNA
ncbi:MAG: RNase adaptor protein RapZ [Nitrosomonadales bacterium SCN 54-20]|nr:RNase adapter RapZ [Nitrosospira multiformis]ODT84449.1 MAG: RNase adaptor protein RapZ [Nitrosomonadales bacterium SCN 54-20]